jgi:TPP-dependent 2-oxoacid decarboxylase
MAGPGRLTDRATTGAERLVATLEEVGVTVAFGLPGVHNLAIWQALSGSSIRLIGVRHEQAAVYARMDMPERPGGSGWPW